MNLATIICIGLLLAMEGSQAQGDPDLRARCQKLRLDFQNCAKKAHADYAQAISAGWDGREAFSARMACNYITQSVEECGNILVGECNSEEKVREMKDHQIENFAFRLSSRDESWDSEKCPVVKEYLDRKRAREGGDDVIAQEQDPPLEPQSQSEPQTAAPDCRTGPGCGPNADCVYLETGSFACQCRYGFQGHPALLICREVDENEPEEVGQASTIEDQVSSLRNETQIKKQKLTRLEAFFEELERRILRLEAANNGTRGVTESVQESMTSPAPETTTNLPCCHKIKLKSRNYGILNHPFVGVYDLFSTEDPPLFNYGKFHEGGEILSNYCNPNELAGYYSQVDSTQCNDPKFKFVTGFTGSCITGPKLYSVLWYNEGQDTWEKDDSLSVSIVCVD